MRLIEAEEVEKITWEDSYYHDPLNVLTEVREKVRALPTIDAVPVRHGKWLDPETFKRPWFRHHIFECSVCRNTLDMDGVNAGRGDANYCPNCGSKMDAERREE